MSRLEKYMDEMCGKSHKKKKKKVDETSNDQKERLYSQGVYQLGSSFNEFSRDYMHSIGQMMQNKKAVDPKYKKLRDTISTAYERLDDSINKHIKAINDAQSAKIDLKRRKL